jgi:hypothetical protein
MLTAWARPPSWFEISYRYQVLTPLFPSRASIVRSCGHKHASYGLAGALPAPHNLYLRFRAVQRRKPVGFDRRVFAQREALGGVVFEEESMDNSLLVTLLGTLASLASLMVAGVQTIRLRQLRRRVNADIWGSVATVRAMIQKLEENSDWNAPVAQVYGNLTQLFRHLIRQAALDEDHFTEGTIEKWRKAGKLTSDWQEAQARQFLPSSVIALSGPPMDQHADPDVSASNIPSRQPK